jgi:hypothetical protein
LGEQRDHKDKREKRAGKDQPDPANTAGKGGREHGKEKGQVEQGSTASDGTANLTNKPREKKRKCSESGKDQTALADLVQMVRTLQEKVDEQSEKLAKQAHQASLGERLLREKRERELEDEEERAMQQDSEIRQLRAELEESKAREAAKFRELDDPEYAARFESLMKTGIYSLESVKAALEATKQDGKYSCTRADAYLKAIHANQRNAVLQQANQALADDQPSIQPGSALARLLGTYGNEDAVDIVVRLKDVHAKRKSSHCAIPAVAAGNLLQAAAVKNDSSMGRKGLSFLSQVASAVCEDCEKCKELRGEAEAAEKWRANKAAAATPAPKALQSEGNSKKRLTLPFKISDSRRDVKRPRGLCGECGKGQEGGKWLYFCDDCGRGFHLLCPNWKHLRHPSGGPTWFSCNDCVELRNRDVAQGDESRDYREVSEEVEHGLAPVSSEASCSATGGALAAEAKAGANRVEGDAVLASNTPAAPPTSNHGATAISRETRRPALVTPTATPEPSSLLQIYGADPCRTGRPGIELDPGTTPSHPTTTGNKATPSMNVKDYFIWLPVPGDWAPKQAPGSKSDSAKIHTHPECGYSKVAYQNWRRKNVTQRDLVKAQGSTLGPLVRGISAEMKVTIGRQFLREPELSWLWPKPVMTDNDIDLWVRADPDFTWVNQIPDETLLSLLDRRFGVKKPDLFLSRKFYEDLPTTDENGDVNYHADLFNRWATEWNTELMELQKSGCDLSHVDLRQTLLTAVSTYKLIHRQALQYNTQSVYLLLAHLCDWVFQEEDNILSARNKRASLVDDKQQGDSTKFTPATKAVAPNRAGGGTAQTGPTKPNPTAQALLTQLTQIAQQLGADSSAGAGGTRPLPAHLKPSSDPNKVNCRGCNNNWDKSRSIPCYKGCKYYEHPEYNKECKTKDGKQNPALTWRNFRERFPQTTPPASFLQWEEFSKNPPQQHKSPTKRPRGDNA